MSLLKNKDISQWTPAELQRFVVNNVLTDPAAIPERDTYADKVVDYLLEQPRLVYVWEFGPMSCTVDGTFHAVSDKYSRVMTPLNIPGRKREYRLAWGFNIGDGGGLVTDSNVEFRLVNSPTLTTGSIPTGGGGFSSNTTSGWKSTLPDDAADQSSLQQVECRANATGAIYTLELLWFMVESRYQSLRKTAS